MHHDPNIFRDPLKSSRKSKTSSNGSSRRSSATSIPSSSTGSTAKRGRPQRKEEIEREFDKEKTALSDYGSWSADFEEQRPASSTRPGSASTRSSSSRPRSRTWPSRTVEEIRRVNEIQERLESLRTKTRSGPPSSRTTCASASASSPRSWRRSPAALPRPRRGAREA